MHKISLSWTSLPIALILLSAGCGSDRATPGAMMDARPDGTHGGPTIDMALVAAWLADSGDGRARDAGLDAPINAAPPALDGPTGYEVTVETHGPILDAQGTDGAVLAPCTGDPSVLIWSDPRYSCGSCGNDVLFPLVCQAGYLACASSYRGSGDVLVNVASNAVVLDIQNHEQCAFMAPYYVPGFGVTDPRDAVTTNRDPALPIKLAAISSYAMLPATFRDVFADRTTGEAVIHSLVTVTDVARGTAVDYTIGPPYVKDKATGQEFLDLTPVGPLTPGTQYRITLYPGTTQQLVKCYTFGRATTQRGTPDTALTAPETTDFTTASVRPYDGGG